MAVIAFTNEEGARFHPDMLGSYVWAGGMSVEAAHAEVDSEGVGLGAELNRIGYQRPGAAGLPEGSRLSRARISSRARCWKARAGDQVPSPASRRSLGSS